MKKNQIKKQKQPKLTRLTRDQGYEIRITSQKRKQKKSQSPRLNNLMSPDKIEKKNQFKKSIFKKTRVNPD